jgi:hypothetical protein
LANHSQEKQEETIGLFRASLIASFTGDWSDLCCQATLGVISNFIVELLLLKVERLLRLGERLLPSLFQRMDQRHI